MGEAWARRTAHRNIVPLAPGPPGPSGWPELALMPVGKKVVSCRSQQKESQVAADLQENGRCLPEP
jgi:hypothetical protein